MRIKLSKQKFRRISIILHFHNTEILLIVKCHFTSHAWFVSQLRVLNECSSNFIYLERKQSGPQCCHPHGTSSPFCPKISKKTKFYKKYFPQFLGHHSLYKKFFTMARNNSMKSRGTTPCTLFKCLLVASSSSMNDGVDRVSSARNNCDHVLRSFMECSYCDSFLHARSKNDS